MRPASPGAPATGEGPRTAGCGGPGKDGRSAVPQWPVPTLGSSRLTPGSPASAV